MEIFTGQLRNSANGRCSSIVTSAFSGPGFTWGVKGAHCRRVSELELEEGNEGSSQEVFPGAQCTAVCIATVRCTNNWERIEETRGCDLSYSSIEFLATALTSLIFPTGDFLSDEKVTKRCDLCPKESSSKNS